jgi:hypothetical protein
MKFKVPILRTGYRQISIVIEAENAQEAIRKAQAQAPNLEYPTEHGHDHQVGIPKPQ